MMASYTRRTVPGVRYSRLVPSLSTRPLRWSSHRVLHLAIMKTKVSVFISTSLDGYIAREDGVLDWLDEANAIVPAGEDCGFGAFMKSVDALVMGRKTYEHVLTFGECQFVRIPCVQHAVYSCVEAGVRANQAGFRFAGDGELFGFRADPPHPSAP